MNRLLILLTLLATVGCNHSEASTIVIAGSQLVAPPPFQNGSFFQVTQVIDRAHPFVIGGADAYRVSELQIAAYRTAGLGGTSARFAVHTDAGGAPGVPLATFAFNSIPLATPAALSATPDSELILNSNTPYWIVGTTNQGQVNWSLALGTPPLIGVNGPNARKLRDDDWIVTPTGSVAAYALLGTPVPESGTLPLAILCATLAAMRRRSE
jgi:hypothetical protein